MTLNFTHRTVVDSNSHFACERKGLADLGMEVIYEFEVTDTPVTVAAENVHDTGRKRWSAKIGKLPVVVA